MLNQRLEQTTCDPPVVPPWKKGDTLNERRFNFFTPSLSRGLGVACRRQPPTFNFAGRTRLNVGTSMKEVMGECQLISKC